jgi:predicted lipid-binding transport protein (Tim44 family)
VARVTTASAEAAADDAAFAAETVTEQAAELFLDVQKAWDARDRDRLRQLVGADLMVEWERRLDDFERKGWHNRVQVDNRPLVEYVGMVNRADDADDRVVVRIEATTQDYVETREGGRIMHNGQSSAATAIKEYWTLDKRDDRWCLLSIEQDAEGVHHLDSEIVASPWGDSRVHDEAVAERAAADAAPAGVSPAELVDIDFAGPARAKAMDLSLADGRFDVDLIETSVRRAVEAWAEAVDGADTDLEAVARPEAVRALLGDADAKTRVVVRGPKVEAVTIAALDAEATPATLAVELSVRARRYVEDRDTVALLSGSRDSESSFTEHWTLALDAEGEWPWRIAATSAATAA